MVKVGYRVGYMLYRKGGKREVGHGRSGYIPDRRPVTGSANYVQQYVSARDRNYNYNYRQVRPGR